MIYYGRNGQRYSLDSSPFAAGGEGGIYNISGQPNMVAKLYKTSPGKEKENKLLAMANKPLEANFLNQVAWPVDVLYDSSRCFVGFIMPKISKGEELGEIYQVGSVKYGKLPWNNKIAMARNLCAVLDAIHEKGYVVGDFNPRNISVNPQNGMVAFFDTDSFQVTDGGKVYRCQVGMAEYLAPELQKKIKAERKPMGELSLPTFTRETDNFALAVHIFQLLMNGAHPFACKVQPSQASVVFVQPTDNITSGNFPFVNPKSGTAIPNYAPEYSALPKPIQDTFHRAFIDGYRSPSVRPDAAEWHNQLSQLITKLKGCTRLKHHEYYNGLSACPWCALEKKMNPSTYSAAPRKRLTQTLYNNPMVSAPTSRVAAPSPTYSPVRAPRVSPYGGISTPTSYKNRTSIEHKLAVWIPILAFVLGQVLQYVIYSSTQKAWPLSFMFGEIPMLFMVISTLSNMGCAAMVGYNAYKLKEDYKDAGARWMYITSSVLLLLVPSVFGAIGLVVYPVMTLFFADKFYREEEEATKALSIAMPLAYFLIAQIAQYYFTSTGISHILFPSFLNGIPMWLRVISTIAGGIATAMASYMAWEQADDGECERSYGILLGTALCLGILPSILAIPGVIVLGIVWYQLSESSEEYIPVTLVIGATVAGQLFMYISHAITGDVPIVSKLMEMTNIKWIDPLVFAYITTGCAIVACIMFVYLGYTMVDNYNREPEECYALLAPYCFLIVLFSSVTAIPLCILGVFFVCIKDMYHVMKKMLISYGTLLAVVVILGILSVATQPDIINQDKVTYERTESGQYEVVAYNGNESSFTIPTLLRDKYEVIGVSEEFRSNNACLVFTFNYENATEDKDIYQKVFLSDANSDADNSASDSTAKTLPVPKREGYEFYGWWTDSNRHAGSQLTDATGEFKYPITNTSATQAVYAMWYDSSYTFLSTESALKDVRLDSNAKYVLTKDIVVTSDFTPIGATASGDMSYFNGMFDGNYHTIRYSISGSRKYSGLFAGISTRGTVKNLFVDANIVVDYWPVSGGDFCVAGGVAAINNGAITQCRTTGTVRLKNLTGTAYAGGIVGQCGLETAGNSTINNCANTAEVDVKAVDAYAGGILGMASREIGFYACYNKGAVSATGKNAANTAAGGIVSYGCIFFHNCYNAGTVKSGITDNTTVGGLLGYVRKSTDKDYIPANSAWLQAEDGHAAFAIGQYPDDTSGGTNDDIYIAKKENNKLAKKLNNNIADAFVIVDDILYLAWEVPFIVDEAAEDADVNVSVMN